MLNTATDPRSGGTGFAVCDEANGWYMPDDGSGNVDTTWEGKCMPACYKSGYQGPNSATSGALLLSNLEDECWSTVRDITYAEYSATPDDILSYTDQLAVYGCGLDPSGATGFCECINDYIPFRDGSGNAVTGYEGQCRSPCFISA